MFVAHGLTSPLNASLELSRRLAAAGHQVTYVSHADIGAEVEAGGFAFVQLTNAQELRRTLRQAIRHPIHWAGSMRRERSRSIKSDELERAIDALAPDLLLIDIEMHYAIIATAALGVPTMLVMNWLSIFRVAGLPPLSSSLLPGDEKAVRRAWLEVRVRALGARVAHKLGRGALGDLLRPVSYGTRFYADLKQVARHRNYPLRTNTDRSQWLRPYMYTQLPVLCFNAYELEFPHRPHPNIRYVGPMVNKQRTERRVSNHDRQRWASFKQHRRGDRPLIYCSLGSYWSDRDFLQMVLRVFSDRPEWDLVLGLGEQVTAQELGEVPDNVLLLDYAPQLAVLAEADGAINHGGITSLNECISYGVPAIVYSPGLLDQEGCAARIAYHNLGVRAAWKKFDPATLERHIELILGDEEIRSNVQAMRLAYERYEREGVAVRVIEDYLAGI